MGNEPGKVVAAKLRQIAGVFERAAAKFGRMSPYRLFRSWPARNWLGQNPPSEDCHSSAGDFTGQPDLGGEGITSVRSLAVNSVAVSNGTTAKLIPHAV